MAKHEEQLVKHTMPQYKKTTKLRLDWIDKYVEPMPGPKLASLFSKDGD